MTKDVISLSISVLLLFRHYISHKIIFGAPISGGVLCSACGAFITLRTVYVFCIRYKFYVISSNAYSSVVRMTQVFDLEKMFYFENVVASF